MKRLGLPVVFLIPSLISQAQNNPFYLQQKIPDRDSMEAIIRNPKDDLDLIKAYRVFKKRRSLGLEVPIDRKFNEIKYLFI